MTPAAGSERGERGVLVTVLAAQALRGLGYGLAAVQLGAVLRGQGLDAAGVGLVLAAIVAGPILKVFGFIP